MSQERLFRGMLDDAAVFPPGNLPLSEALSAHGGHRSARYSATVGPLVLSTRSLHELSWRAGGLPAGSLEVSLVTSLDGLAEAARVARAIAAVRLVAVEVSVPEGAEAQHVVAAVRRDTPEDAEKFVEIPRDTRRESVVEALAGTEIRAKLRAGGIRADLYPDETELAQVLALLARHDVRFKATAGLHHAIRNTDPETGFEQHGFLNLLLAAAQAWRGATAHELHDVLASRDSRVVADKTRELDIHARELFGSFGTCEVAQPIQELVELQLLPRDYAMAAAE